VDEILRHTRLVVRQNVSSPSHCHLRETHIRTTPLPWCRSWCRAPRAVRRRENERAISHDLLHVPSDGGIVIADLPYESRRTEIGFST
jgi:hypothetical protein